MYFQNKSFLLPLLALKLQLLFLSSTISSAFCFHFHSDPFVFIFFIFLFILSYHFSLQALVAASAFLAPAGIVSSSTKGETIAEKVTKWTTTIPGKVVVEDHDPDSLNV